MNRIAILIAGALPLAVACGLSAGPSQTEPPVATIQLAPSPVPTVVDTATPEARVADVIATPRPISMPLDVVVPPCIPFPGSNIDPCMPRDFLWWFRGENLPPEMWPTLRESILYEGPPRYADSLPTYAAHFVARATIVPDSIRCAYTEFRSFLHHAYYYDYRPPGPQFPGRVHCFVDLAVNEYIVGSGPSRLSVKTIVVHSDVTVKFECELDSEIDSECRDRVLEYEASEVMLDESEGLEWVMFLSAPRDLGSLAWEVYWMWDVQRRQDGKIVAVHPMRSHYRENSLPHQAEANAERLELALDDLRAVVKDAYSDLRDKTGGKISVNPSWSGQPAPPFANYAGTDALIELVDGIGALADLDLTPLVPPPMTDESNLLPNGLTVDNVIATRVAGGTAP